MKTRYDLCPQFKIYDEIFPNYLNHLMFTQSPGIRTNVCNTDVYGARFNSGNNLSKQKSIFDEYIEFAKNEDTQEQGVVLGGSQVFGVGATSDYNTISSTLTRLTKNFYFNLGGRAFNGMQEIIQLLLFINKFKKLKKILIISGINELYMFSENSFSKKFPGPMYNNQFFTENLKNLKGNLKDKLIRKIKLKNVLSHDDFPIINIGEVIERNIKMLSIISNGLKTDIEFFLSPYIFWAKNEDLFSDEEKILIKDSNNNNVYELMAKNYNMIKEVYEKNCKKNSIKFFDLNEMFKKKVTMKEWLFTDRVHCTDLGYKYCAEIILNKNFS